MTHYLIYMLRGIPLVQPVFPGLVVEYHSAAQIGRHLRHLVRSCTCQGGLPISIPGTSACQILESCSPSDVVHHEVATGQNGEIAVRLSETPSLATCQCVASSLASRVRDIATSLMCSLQCVSGNALRFDSDTKVLAIAGPGRKRTITQRSRGHNTER